MIINMLIINLWEREDRYNKDEIYLKCFFFKYVHSSVQNIRCIFSGGISAEEKKKDIFHLY